jgi:trehalose 6-phosphate phosphatase
MTIANTKIPLPVLDISRTAFLLDVDGTLLEIAPVPGAVIVPHGLVDCLAHLHQRNGGAVAFISGRTIAQLDELFRPLKLSTVGAHGGEIRFPDGRQEHAPAMAAELKRAFTDAGAIDPKILIEDKHCSLAFHYRLVPDEGPALIAALTAEAARLHRDDLQLLKGKSIIEIKPKSYNKATGLRKLMNVAPFAGRKPWFAGDDMTDEDVFAALPEFGGTGIAVGRKLPNTSFLVDGPHDIRDWIHALLQQGKD